MARSSAQVSSSPPKQAGYIDRRVDQLLGELLSPAHSERLNAFRLSGSTNRVYRIPLDEGGGDFVIVKLLPSAWVHIRKRAKRFIRNLVLNEHDIMLGRGRALAEIERTLEWQREGLLVPPVIHCSFPYVRVFKGLHYPTFYTILTSPDFSIERKLEILAAVTQSLSSQHSLAVQRGKKSLVHRDPGPWNIMVDLQTNSAYWFDLEHAADYPRTTLEDMMTRALRIYLAGVTEYLEERLDAAVEVVCENYELRPVLWRLAHRFQSRRTVIPLRVASAVGLKRQTYRRWHRIAARLKAFLEQDEGTIAL